MLQTVITILKQSAIYGLGKVSNRIVGFVLLPLYTEKIAISDYGIFALLEAIIQISAVFFGFGLKGALFRWLNIYENEEKKGSIIFTTLLWTLILSVFIIQAGFYLKEPIAKLLVGSQAYSHLFNYVFILIGLEIIRSILFSLVRIYQKALLYSIISVLSVILNLGFNIYLVVYLDFGIEGILISNIVSSIFITGILLFYFAKQITFKIETAIFIEMIKYGFPLIFSTIASSAIVFSDRFLIEYFMPVEFVGKYTFVYKIAGIINIFLIQSFLLAWPAIAWQNIKKPEPEKFIKKILSYFIFISTWFTLILALFSKDIVFMLTSNPEYGDAYNIIPIISFSFIFYGIYHIIGFSLHYKKQTKYFAYFIVSAAALNIMLNYIFIPVYGLMGAASATFFAYLTMAVSSYKISIRFFPVKYEMKKIFTILITALGLFLIFITLRNITPNFIIYVNILLSMLFPAVLHYLKIIDLRGINKLSCPDYIYRI